MARTKVRWEFNVAGFAALRNDPTLVSAMESSMTQAVEGTPFDVVVWPHQGSGSGPGGGPRTSVQAWAQTAEAHALLRRDPSAMHAVLQRTGIPFVAKNLYVTQSGKVRTATDAQIANWTRGRR